MEIWQVGPPVPAPWETGMRELMRKAPASHTGRPKASTVVEAPQSRLGLGTAGALPKSMGYYRPIEYTVLAWKSLHPTKQQMVNLSRIGGWLYSVRHKANARL